MSRCWIPKWQCKILSAFTHHCSAYATTASPKRRTGPVYTWLHQPFARHSKCKLVQTHCLFLPSDGNCKDIQCVSKFTSYVHVGECVWIPVSVIPTGVKVCIYLKCLADCLPCSLCMHIGRQIYLMTYQEEVSQPWRVYDRRITRKKIN